jgi:hypothetical protein
MTCRIHIARLCGLGLLWLEFPGFRTRSSSRETSLPDDVEGDAARGGSCHSIDFRFLPKILTEKTRQLIETYHGIYGYSKVGDLLWQSEIRVFIVTQRDLAPVFRKASTARCAKQANRGLAPYLAVARTAGQRFCRMGKALSICQA